jgi:hypothetical protein
METFASSFSKKPNGSFATPDVGPAQYADPVPPLEGGAVGEPVVAAADGATCNLVLRSNIF